MTNLYIRYAPLKSIKFLRSITTRFITISILTVKNLYEKFYKKKKPAISTVKCALNSLANQNPSLRNSKYRSEILISSVKSSFFIKHKFISRSLTTQQQHYIKSFRHVALIDIRVKTIRSDNTLFEYLAIAINKPIRFQTSDIT